MGFAKNSGSADKVLDWACKTMNNKALLIQTFGGPTKASLGPFTNYHLSLYVPLGVIIVDYVSINTRRIYVRECIYVLEWDLLTVMSV